MADTAFLESVTLEPESEDMRHILNLSAQQLGLGTDKLSSNVDFVISELSRCLAMNETNSPYDARAVQCQLERLRLMLKIKSVSHFQVDGCKKSSAAVSEERLVTNCLLALRQLSNGDEDIISILCDIFGLCLIIIEQNSENMFWDVVFFRTTECITALSLMKTATFDNDNINKVDILKPIIDLKVLETIIDVLSISKGLLKSNINWDKFNFLNNSNVHDLILGLIIHSSELITAQTLLCIVPKYVTCTSSNTLLINIWEHISSWLSNCISSSTLTIHRVFLILCTLADFLIPESAIQISLNLLEDSMFWILVQQGLVHNDYLLRKQALYLLKRAIDRVSFNKVRVHLKNDILIWEPNSTAEQMQTWEQFFLVLETIEEKQVHLIHPVLLVVSNLVNARESTVGTFLHESWIICLFQRLMQHDNNSVVKWGVENLLQLSVNYFISRDPKTLLVLLLNVLNNSHLFSRNFELTGSALSENLVQFFANLSTLPQDTYNIFSDLVHILSSISWDPIPLFYVLHALASLQDMQLFDCSALTNIRAFVTDAIGTQNIYIRGGIQCQLLLSIIHLTNTSLVDLSTVSDVLGSFRRSESLCRGTSLWTKTVNWLKSSCDSEKANTFIGLTVMSLVNQQADIDAAQSPTEIKSLARMILLLSDAGLLEGDGSARNESSNTMNSLLNLFSCFKNCEVRLYACEKTQDTSLELLAHLLKEAATIDKDAQEPPATKAILLVIHSILKDVLMYIKRRIFTISHLRDFHVVNLYIDALLTFSSDANLFGAVANNLEKFQDRAIQMITVYSDTSSDTLCSPLQKYTSMRVLAWISECLKNEVFQLDSVITKQNDFIEEIIKSGSLNSIFQKSQFENDLTRDLQTLWGHLVSGYLQAKWRIFTRYLESGPNCGRLDLNADVLECLEIGGRNVLIDVMQVLEVILPDVGDGNNAEQTLLVVEACWVATFDLRKVELFWVAMRQFVKMAYQRNTVNRVWLQQHLKKYAREIFEHGHAVTGLANVLMVRLQEELSADVLGTYSEVVIDALLFGPLHRRDQKYEDDTLAYIKQLGKECSTNELISCDCRVDNRVRASGVALLLRVINSNDTSAAALLLRGLLQRDRDETAGKTRYFGDSHVHRLKHRVMQSLLILATVLGKADVAELYASLCASLLTGNHQPSVRYQQEWLLCRLLLRWPHLRDAVWSNFSAAAAQRPGSMCSFIAVAYLTACSLGNADTQEAFIDKAIQMTFPWCMAQHFNVRIYAQVALKKLWAVSKDKGLEKILAKYSLVLSSLQIGVDHGNAFKNAAKLQEDFYLTEFDPVGHFSLATIYAELPRLANLADSELISVEVLTACGVGDEQPLVPLRSRDGRLEDRAAAAWSFKATGGNEDGENSSSNVPYNIQKKMIPWRAMIPDTRTLLSDSGSENKCKKKSSDRGLIVVASLIDRPPNLGGLCRTCEVFGATEYVLGNLKYVEDKQFQSLSVSAERWIPMTEVQPHVLPQYLAAMKKDGYTLIGAEQTSNSTAINELKFPKKTLLLLGNEKEGVPADLLPLLDVCVAVPQQGLVRSLNVHVTGAIFVWEYSKQHHLA